MLKKAALVAAISSALVIGGAGAASAARGAPYIEINDTGRPVACVQIALNLHYGNVLAQDGIFGSGTESVVKRLQRDAHLSVDGIVGPKTGQLLYDELKARHSTHKTECWPLLPTTSATP